ncbi:LCCL domain-containing protein [Flavimaricola marinus]|nr:LCCL domain-containing protein [Flavimaricola marinus]
MTAEECSAYPTDAPSYTCSCPPYDDTGSVWGSGPYTADSAICVAAIHAGVISSDGGEVTALLVDGLPSYRGGEANGITTRDWGSYGQSFIFNRN